jgi:UDP-N-acetylmuramate--alanine ligase
MIASVLTRAGLKPTVAVGGKVNGFNENAWLGKRDYLVAEADESDGSFLRMRPEMAVITNIDAEHLDHYRDLEEIKEAFLSFFKRVPPGGTVVLCWDDPHLRELSGKISSRRLLTYGLLPEAEVSGRIIREGPQALFGVTYRGRYLGEVKLSLPGRHNVQNALAALAVGLSLGLPFSRLSEGLTSFSGVRRRLETKGRVNGILVLDDYAHHPTEIKATF